MGMTNYKAKHFNFSTDNRIATISLTGAKQKNPLTFESYAELRDVFRELVYCDEIHAVVLGSNEGNFCSGGSVNDIIGPLVKMTMKELLNFTRMTGDVIKAMINCQKPIIASIDGICVGAGAILAMASDIRIATTNTKTAFLFTRVGLAGCDMGACAILPRLIGQGRAAELLYTGRVMTSEEGDKWGFYNKVVTPEDLISNTNEMAKKIIDGPAFGNMMTKTMLAQEWSMSIEQIIESEAQAQAICMQTGDFKRAYEAFIAKKKPKFQGN
jgi:enoyl-CoA hydratase/carnithine racemase